MSPTASTSNYNADAFNAAAVMAVIKLSRSLETLTADDVLSEIPETLRAGNARLLASVFAESARAGLIAKTDRFVRSKRTRGPLTVWQSRLYKK